MRSISYPAVLLAAALLGGAAHAQQPIAVTMPDGKPDGAKGSILPDGTLRLDIGKAELWIQVQNFPNNDMTRAHRAPGGWWKQPPMMPMEEPYLRIWLQLMPGPERLEVDLREFLLATTGDDSIPPSGFQGPGIGKTEDSMDPWYGCGDPPPDLKPKKLRAPPTKGLHWDYALCYNCPRSAVPFQDMGEPIRVEVPSCFVVRYEMSNSPEQPFQMHIGGLTLDGSAVELAPIKFKMGRMEHFPSVYRPDAGPPGAPGRGP